MTSTFRNVVLMESIKQPSNYSEGKYVFIILPPILCMLLSMGFCEQSDKNISVTSYITIYVFVKA